MIRWLSVTTAIAATVLSAIGEGIAAVSPQVVTDGRSNAAVYVLFLRGRELETHGSEQDLNAARDLYEQALELDHSFALAHAGLSIVVSNLARSSADRKRLWPRPK